MSLGRVLSILLLVGTAIGLYNVYADNTLVVEQAKRLACGDRACDAKVVRESRFPISQSFTIQTRLITRGGHATRDATVDVECRREFFLVGDYACK